MTVGRRTGEVSGLIEMVDTADRTKVIGAATRDMASHTGLGTPIICSCCTGGQSGITINTVQGSTGHHVGPSCRGAAMAHDAGCLRTVAVEINQDTGAGMTSGRTGILAEVSGVGGMVRQLAYGLLGMTGYAMSGCAGCNNIVAGCQRRAVLPVRIGVTMTGSTDVFMLVIDVGPGAHRSCR